MAVQTCQYGEGHHLNCIQSLRKRLSMRSCNYSGVLIMPWHDVIVLVLHTSVGVFLKEVAFVAPSWWLLSRSCSLHQGDILEWQRHWGGGEVLNKELRLQGDVSPYCQAFAKGNACDSPGFPVASLLITILLIMKRSCILLTAVPSNRLRKGLF